MGGSQHVVILREVAVLGARDAEVHDLDVAIGLDHDVLRLDVAVDDLVLMRDGERGADLAADLRDLLGVERAVAADAALEVGAAQVFHHDEIGVAVAAPVIDAHDVGALQAGGRLGLLLEAGGEGGVAGVLRQHDLHGDGAVEHLVLCAVDGRHAARSDLVLEEVPSSQYARFFHSLTPHPKKRATSYLRRAWLCAASQKCYQLRRAHRSRCGLGLDGPRVRLGRLRGQ